MKFKNVFRKIFPPILFILIFNSLSAQKVNFYTYPKNYPMRKTGYPSYLVPGDSNNFYFAEFWTRDADHPLTDLYIQGYASQPTTKFGQSEVKLRWARPIHDGEHPYDFQGLTGLKKGVMVWGKAPDKQYGGTRTVARFWSKDGSPRGPLQMLSTYFKEVSGFSDRIITSPDRHKILWLGTNDEAEPADRKYYCSVWSDEGRMQWGHEVKMPYGAEGYVVRQTAVDNRGNVYFFLIHSKKKNELGEEVTVPRIVKYEYKTRTFHEQFLSFACTRLHEAEMFFSEDENLYVMATLQTAAERSFPVLNADGTVKMRWSEIAVHRLETFPEWKHVNSAQWPIPDTLNKLFPSGAYFTGSQFASAKGQLFWFREESRSKFQAVQTEYRFGDAAVLALSTDSLKPQWTAKLPKEQIQKDGTEKCSFLSTVTEKKLCTVYPTGPSAKLVLTSFDRLTGYTSVTELHPGEAGKYDVLINKGTVTEGKHFLFLGPGAVKENAFILSDIYRLP